MIDRIYNYGPEFEHTVEQATAARTKDLEFIVRLMRAPNADVDRFGAEFLCSLYETHGIRGVSGAIWRLDAGAKLLPHEQNLVEKLLSESTSESTDSHAEPMAETPPEPVEVPPLPEFRRPTVLTRRRLLTAGLQSAAISAILGGGGATAGAVAGAIYEPERGKKEPAQWAATWVRNPALVGAAGGAVGACWTQLLFLVHESDEAFQKVHEQYKASLDEHFAAQRQKIQADYAASQQMIKKNHLATMDKINEEAANLPHIREAMRRVTQLVTQKIIKRTQAPEGPAFP